METSGTTCRTARFYSSRSMPSLVRVYMTEMNGGSDSGSGTSSGPPQYTRRSATIVSNNQVGQGSYLVRCQWMDEYPDVDDDPDVDEPSQPQLRPLLYEPGHVLALEIPHPENPDQWFVGPYTVTRANEKSFDIMYRVVGKKTETLKHATVGSHVRFGGMFKVPILRGIDMTSQSATIRSTTTLTTLDSDAVVPLERVVGISTGVVGVGPLIGFAEQALQLNDFSARIDLYVCVRQEQDICGTSVMDNLVHQYGTDKFTWTSILSSEDENGGHCSSYTNLRRIATSKPTTSGATHYHMIGNGSMVNEWTEGLKKNAGVPNKRITFEMYFFNHKVSPRPDAVSAIQDVLKEVTLTTVHGVNHKCS